MCLERPWDATQFEKKGPTCLELFGVSNEDTSIRFQMHFNDDLNPWKESIDNQFHICYKFSLDGVFFYATLLYIFQVVLWRK